MSRVFTFRETGLVGSLADDGFMSRGFLGTQGFVQTIVVWPVGVPSEPCALGIELAEDLGEESGGLPRPALKLCCRNKTRVSRYYTYPARSMDSGNSR